MSSWRSIPRVAVLCILSAASLTARQPPHSLPRGVRVAPLPSGEGGALWIRAPSEFCGNPANEFHLHQRLDDGGIRFVAELPIDQSACEWRFDSLATGHYEALIQVAATQRTLARGEAQVVTAVTGLMTLEAMTVRIQGFVTSSGRPRPDLKLRFQPDGPIWMPEAPVAIRKDGWYDVLLGDRDRHGNTQKYCARLSAAQAANHITACGDVQP